MDLTNDRAKALVVLLGMVLHVEVLEELIEALEMASPASHHGQAKGVLWLPNKDPILFEAVVLASSWVACWESQQTKPSLCFGCQMLVAAGEAQALSYS
jgi:hypothetical protein